MYLLRRITPGLFALFIASCLAALVWFPHVLLVLTGEGRIGARSLGAVLGALLAASCLAMLMVGAEHPISSRLRFLLLPFTTLVSVFVWLTFLEHQTWGLVLIGGTAVALWLWYESLYLFWQQPQWYQPYTLQRLSSFLYVFAFFIFVAAVAGLYVYLQMRFWAVAILVAMASAAFLLDGFLLAQMPVEKAIPASLFGSLLALEWFFAISYLPTHPMLMAAFMSLFLYFWSGFAKLWSQNACNRTQLTPYVAVSVAGFLMSVASALWII